MAVYDPMINPMRTEHCVMLYDYETASPSLAHHIVELCFPPLSGEGREGLLPFGELFIEERTTWNTPYKFSAKELDDETGYSYFGARYYDPNIFIWLSVDPLADHPNQVDKSPYVYAWNNPVYYTDPDGNCPLCPWIDAVVDIGFVAYDLGKLAYDKVTKGETKSEDWAALGADVASILVPMSVGAGLALRSAYRMGKLSSGALRAFSVGRKVDNVKSFASKGLLNGHFAKHASEFGGKFKNAEEYLKGAQNFFRRESDDIIQYSRGNGDIVRYDTKNNIFGSISKDGTIKTMFKPDSGIEYFKAEVGRDLGEKTLKELTKVME